MEAATQFFVAEAAARQSGTGCAGDLGSQFLCASPVWLLTKPHTAETWFVFHHFCFLGQGLNSDQQDKIPGPQNIFKIANYVSWWQNRQTCKRLKYLMEIAPEEAALPLCLEKMPQYDEPQRQAVHSLKPVFYFFLNNFQLRCHANRTRSTENLGPYHITTACKAGKYPSSTT